MELIRGDPNTKRTKLVERIIEKESIASLRTYDKIRRIEELPTEKECIEFMNKVDWKFGGGTYAGMLMSNGYHQIVHKELIKDLQRIIPKLKTVNNVEICAGRGKISYWLNKSGIEIAATDSGKTIKSANVERLNHIQTLKRYNPDFVLVASQPYNSIVLDVLKYESVKYVAVLKKGADLLSANKKDVKKLATNVRVIKVNTYPAMIDSMMNFQKSETEPMTMINKDSKKTLLNVFQSIMITTKRV